MNGYDIFNLALIVMFIAIHLTNKRIDQLQGQVDSFIKYMGSKLADRKEE